MIDASYIKVHQDGTGTKGGNQHMGRTKGGSTQRCTQSCELMEGFDAGYILADRGYDSNSFIEYIEEHGMEAVIPPRKN